jgi:5-formyltetrahydrofolate cyclo-ligase
LDIWDEKQTLRKRVAEQRRGFDQAWVTATSATIQQRAMALREFVQAATVACYIAMRGEVQTEEIVRQCRLRRKRVCLPAFRTETGRYELAVWAAGMPLSDGAGHTREPERKDWVSAGAVELAFVPGMAFDAQGRRLGRGGGHYDAILSAMRQAADGRSGQGRFAAVGLAFESQMMECVPAGERDASVDWVVTERRTVQCAQVAL